MYSTRSSVPLLPVVPGVVAGILLGRYIPGYDWCMAVSAALSVMAIMLKWRVASVITAALTLGWLTMALNRPAVIADCVLLDDVPCVGIVTDTRNSSEGIVVSEISLRYVDGRHIRPVNVELTGRALPDEYQAGDYVRFVGRWSPPRVSRDIPGSDDRSDYYYSRSISARCFAAEDSVSIVGRDDGIYYRLRRQTSKVADAAYSSGLTRQAAGFVTAIITGDSDAVADSDRERFSASGIAHVLALSGMHVGLIILFASLILMPVDLSGKRQFRLWATIIIIWIYAMATGLGASVVRAAIMATMYMLGRITQRRNDGLNSVCAAAIIILVPDPLQLFRAGFQLSFAAVISILLLAPRLNPVSRRNAVSHRIAECILVPVTAVIGTGVLTIYYFHRFVPLFLVSNIPVAIMLPVLFIAALLMLLIPLPCVTGILSDVVQWLYDAMDNIAEHTGNATDSPFDNIYIDAAEAWALYITLGALAAWFCLHRRTWGYVGGACAVATILIFALRGDNNRGMEYHITGTARYTDIVIRDGRAYYLVTTSLFPSQQSVYESFETRNRDYIRRNGLQYRGMLSPGMTITGSGTGEIRYDGNLLQIGDRKLRLLTDGDCSHPQGGHADYALVTRLFTGDTGSLARYADADTVVLLREINRRRALRYAKELHEAGIPYRLLQ